MNESLRSDCSKSPFNPSGGQKKTKGDLLFHRVAFKNAAIVLMNHPSSLTIYNHVSLQVLSGSVSIFGYEMNRETSDQNDPLRVFSSEKTGLIEVKTESCERIWKNKEQTSVLQNTIYKFLGDEEKAIDLMQKFGNSTVAIHLQVVDTPICLKFLEQYYPSVVKFDIYKCRERYMLHVLDHHKKKYMPIQFGVQEEKLSGEINGSIRSASLKDLSSPRIVVCGPKNSGKSTLIRFLINKIISEFTAVCHLETDSGQTEFTPPGVFSLTKISKPVIGPPFYHQQEPVSMIFSGSVSPTDPNACDAAINKLMHLYCKDFKTIPLIVNTMGWMEGVGLECLASLIKTVKPTLLVEIVIGEEGSFFDYREFMPENSSYHQIRCSHPKNSYFSPKELREMSLLSYFSKVQPNLFFETVLLNKIKPRCLSLDNIAIYAYHNKLVPFRLVDAMNQSIVALCDAPKHQMLENSNPLLPKTLKANPICECLGYGFVSAIDEEKQLFYVISPLSEEKWRKVNAVLKGTIPVPDCLILNQEIYDTELPYTDVREKVLQIDTDEEMIDESMASVLRLLKNIPTPSQSTSAASYSPLSHNQMISKKSKKE